jgi:hypothetical protein
MILRWWHNRQSAAKAGAQQAHPHESMAADSGTVVGGEDSLFGGRLLPLRATFYPLGYAVDILTNQRVILDAAHESFGHRSELRRALIPPVRIGVYPGVTPARPVEPTCRQYSGICSLAADRDNQALLDLGRCFSFVRLTPAAASDRLYLRYNFIEKVVYLLLGASVVTDLHAACVSRNGKGLLLCGDSGAGKSTLAYACAREGWTYTSDDTSYLINDSRIPRVIGHAHRVRFRPSARELFPELEDKALSPRLEGKPSIEVSTAALPMGRTAAESPVHAVVFLRRSPGVSARLDPLSAGSAVGRLSAGLFSAGVVRAKHESGLGILGGVPAWELHYSDLNDAIGSLEAVTRMA